MRHRLSSYALSLKPHQSYALVFCPEPCVLVVVGSVLHIKGAEVPSPVWEGMQMFWKWGR